MNIEIKMINSLDEYMKTISDIRDNDEENFKPNILWFRGQSNASFSLIPSLFRTNNKVSKNFNKQNYSELHYAEDIRMQHYIAKNYHLLLAEPSSRIEWLEVMQHHQINTRLLDWSESSIHSLIFAIEVFFSEKRFSDYQRQKCLPCVWVLKPWKLNKKIISYLSMNADLQKKLIGEMNISIIDKKRILRRIREYSQFEKYAELDDTYHIDYLFNLSSIVDDITRNMSRIKELLCNGEIINPYYYLLSRIFSDGYILSKRVIPPLSIVHPYHSERIKAQRGVFTVFPFYEEQEGDNELRKMNINPDSMDYNELAKDCLVKIIINKPQIIALQLMKNGMNDSWLYPEMPIVSSEIESHFIC